MANDLRWNPVSVNFGDANQAMGNALRGISQAGTVFGDLRKQILDQEQRALDNAFREQQFKESVRQFDANYGLTKARDEESARHNKQTEINTRYATDVGAQSARYAADRSYASHLDAIKLQADLANQQRIAQANADSAAMQALAFGSPLYAEQQKAQALADSNANIKKLQDERLALENMGKERDTIVSEMYNNHNLSEAERDALGARYRALNQTIENLPGALAQKDQEIAAAQLRHGMLQNTTFTGRGRTDAENWAIAANAAKQFGAVPSFMNDMIKQSLGNAGIRDLAKIQAQTEANRQQAILKTALEQRAKDANAQTPAGLAKGYDPGYQESIQANYQKMFDFAEKSGKRLDPQAAQDIFDAAFQVQQESIPIPIFSPNLNKEPGPFSGKVAALALENLATSRDPRIQRIRDAILGLGSSRSIYRLPSISTSSETSKNNSK